MGPEADWQLVAVGGVQTAVKPWRHQIRPSPEQGKLYQFVAIDRTSKLAFAQLHQAANVKTAAGFLQALVKAVLYQIHTVPTR